MFEVKDSLLPVNAQEMRTSWDCVVKAAEQLDRISGLFREPGFLQYLERKTGAALVGASRICTAIVLTNRMFTGYRFGKHPVRGAYDLRQFIENGTIAVNGHSKLQWRGSEFTEGDLLDMLEQDSTLMHLWNALDPIEHEIVLNGKVEVTAPTVWLDAVKMARDLGLEEVLSEVKEEFVRGRVARANEEKSRSLRDRRKQLKRTLQSRKRRHE